MKKDKIKISEQEIEEQFCTILAESGAVVSRQVPLSQKRIDLVTYDNEIITAFELKVKDWRTGLRQATVNMIACNESYVAVWYKHGNFAQKARDLFERHGVGLVIIQEDFSPTVVIKAKKRARNMISKSAYDNLKEHVQLAV